MLQLLSMAVFGWTVWRAYKRNNEFYPGGRG